MSSSQDWQGVVGIPDPTPGDSSTIQTLAGAYGTVADSAGQALSVLASVQAGGTGQAMSAFASRLESLPGHIRTLAGSYQEASSALGTYATALSGAQDQTNQAWAQAGPAHQDLGTSQQEVAYWQNQLDQLPATDAAGRAQASLNLSTAQSQQSDAQGRLTAARSLAQQAAETRQAAAHAAVTSVDEAASHTIPDRSVWQKISDWFHDNPWFSWILTALAVILPFLGPIGIALGLVAGGVLLGSQILDMALTGKWSASDLVLGILSLIPGLGELGGFAKLGARLGELAEAIPGLDKVFGSLGGTAKEGLAKLSEEIHLDDAYTDIHGNTITGDIKSRPLYDGNGKVIGINLQSTSDWISRQRFWRNFNPKENVYNIHTRTGIRTRTTPWAKTDKVVFVQAHASEKGFKVLAKDSAGNLAEVRVDGKQFAKIVQDAIDKNKAAYDQLLSQPDAKIYLCACKSGSPLFGSSKAAIADDFAKEFGRETFAPTTNNKNFSWASGRINGKTVINIDGTTGLFIRNKIRTFQPAPGATPWTPTFPTAIGSTSGVP